MKFGRTPRWTTGMLVAVLAAAAAAGCTPRPEIAKVTWEKPGGTSAQMKQDVGLCGADFDAAGRPLVHQSKLHEVDRCMRARGYEVDLAK